MKGWIGPISWMIRVNMVRTHLLTLCVHRVVMEKTLGIGSLLRVILRMMLGVWMAIRGGLIFV